LHLLSLKAQQIAGGTGTAAADNQAASDIDMTETSARVACCGEASPGRHCVGAASQSINGVTAMAVTVDRMPRRALHPFHAFLLAGAVPLFLGALLGDITYFRSYQIQWSNFASWLIAGALVFAGFALLWAVIDLFRADRHRGRPLIYVLLLLATWVLGFLNALIHARDAWGIMPTALVLSVIVAVLACAATWVGFSNFRTGGAA
jgi:uncharacterized membrane protein